MGGDDARPPQVDRGEAEATERFGRVVGRPGDRPLHQRSGWTAGVYELGHDLVLVVYGAVAIATAVAICGWSGGFDGHWPAYSVGLGVLVLFAALGRLLWKRRRYTIAAWVGLVSIAVALPAGPSALGLAAVVLGVSTLAIVFVYVAFEYETSMY